ncbi:MAG: hypothetical protein FD133_1844 [Erysipelotrichaceae bacterium]|nr:MAG: hypothetical protein FD133_1844 [Erysipelotrichaceae bacterium]
MVKQKSKDNEICTLEEKTFELEKNCIFLLSNEKSVVKNLLLHTKRWLSKMQRKKKEQQNY